MQLSDPGSWGGGTRRSGFVGHPEINDEIKAIRLSAARKFEGSLSEVSFGVNYADREKSKDPFQSLLYLPGNVSHVARAGGLPHGCRERRVLRPRERRHRLRRHRPVEQRLLAADRRDDTIRMRVTAIASTT